MQALNGLVKAALERNDLAAVADMAVQNRRAVASLIRIAYAKETLIGWRAIIAVGMIARRLVSSDAEFLREACRKLLWSLSDESGGIGWSAPELLGEIVSASPRQFADLIPLIAEAYDVEEDVFRSGVLYALARIAEQAPELSGEHQKAIMRSLADREPLVRIRGIMLIGILWPKIRDKHLWSPEYVERLHDALVKLEGDMGEAWIYSDVEFISVTVNDEAINVLKTID